jgi:uncharacterized protein involved in outer membrane biogenesis
MRALKWVVGVGAAIVVVVVIVVAVLVLRYDFNSLKPEIAKAAKEATGRELKLAGDIKLELGLSPALVVHDVSFGNADWGSKSKMASIKRFEVEVALIPLISGNIKIKRLILIEPEILIETDKRGRSNLEFSTAEPETLRVETPRAEATPETTKAEASDDTDGELSFGSFEFDKLLIEKGILIYRDGVTGESHRVDLARAELAAKGLMGGMIKLDVEGSYNEVPFDAKGKVGDIKGLLTHEASWPIEISAGFGGARVELNGAIIDVLASQEIELDFSVDAPDLGELLALAKSSELPENISLSASGHLSSKASGVYDLTKLKAVLGGSDIGGNLSVDTRQKRTFIKGSFSSEVIDLIAFLPTQSASLLGAANVAKAPHNVHNLTPKAALSGVLRPNADNGTDAWTESASLKNTLTKNNHTHQDSFFDNLVRSITEGNLAHASALSAVSANASEPPKYEPIPFELLRLVDADIGMKVGEVRLPQTQTMITNLSLKMNLKAGRLKVKPLKFNFDKSDVKLTLDINASKSRQRPNIKARLSSSLLDLRPFLKGDDEGGDDKGSKSSASDKVFSNEPLELRPLKEMDATVEVRIAKLFLANLAVDTLETDVTLKRGVLSLKPSARSKYTARLGGGTVMVRLDLNAWKNKPSLSARLDVDGLDLGRMLKDLDLTDKKDELQGELSANIDVKGSGKSIAEIMASLDGKVSVIMGEGRVANKYMSYLGDGLTLNFERLLNPAKKKSEYTAVNCLVCSMKITEGIARTEAMVFDTELMTVVGTGKVNLRNEKLGVSLKPKPKEGLSQSKYALNLGELATLFKLGGTLAKPKLTLAPLESATALGDAALGILDMLSGKEKEKTVEENPCVTALAIASGRPAVGSKTTTTTETTEEKSTVEDVADDVTEGVKDLGKELEKGLKGLFGR